MKYVIMADGKMERWKKDCDIPKHLVKIGSETLLERLVRQLNDLEEKCETSDITITSHDERYKCSNAKLYAPKNNVMEIDRFTWELIEDGVCFLYGDTFYSDEAIRSIATVVTDEIHFVATQKTIVAVICADAKVMQENIRQVKADYNKGLLKECKGWQLYYNYRDNWCHTQERKEDAFTLIQDETQGFNTLDEYNRFMEAGFK